uniref:Acyltransferase n=1 Tax=Odontella aurita TaxID=265563 RepID=A0A7S4IJ80_9STRA|mmetsp:Transcript_2582/g.6714  ORF Transcript_2582/g.6714 Transcript_2582/m.6714 type:complete len:327 (+) Transcript_2582:181-1161(+)
MRTHKPSFYLKTCAFLWWNWLYATAVSLCLFLLLGSFYYPSTIGLYVLVPYLSYTILFRRDEVNKGNPWPSFSKNFPGFRCLQEYLGLEFKEPLPKELVEAENIDEAQFIFAVFPHGTNVDYRIIMDGMLGKVLPNVAKKLRVLSASVLFRLPLVREFSLWTHCIDARRFVAEKNLDNGMSLLVIPGGMDEQLRTVYGKETIFLSKRKGFIKLAMRQGIPIVPVYIFGCSDMFRTSNAFFRFRLWIMKTVGACIPLCMGLAGSFCPLPIKTTVVFGKPMAFEIKKVGAPSVEEVNRAHATFTDAVLNLFDEHKNALGYGDRELHIL